MKYFFKDNYPSKKPWKKALLIISLVSVGFYIAFMVGYFATSHPRFCGTCHQIVPIYSSWRESPHQGVNCLYCHEQRGFVGKLHSKSKGLNYTYQQMTGQYTIVTRGQVFEQNCIACHLGDYYNYPNVTRLDTQHYEFLKEDRSCLECHRNTGHEINLFSAKKFRETDK